MPKRIIVNLKPEARSSLHAVAANLTDRVDMRVGLSMPRYGMIVGEVEGQMEVDRIAAMAEVEAVRVHATVPRPGSRRTARTSRVIQ